MRVACYPTENLISLRRKSIFFRLRKNGYMCEKCITECDLVMVMIRCPWLFQNENITQFFCFSIFLLFFSFLLIFYLLMCLLLHVQHTNYFRVKRAIDMNIWDGVKIIVKIKNKWNKLQMDQQEHHLLVTKCMYHPWGHKLTCFFFACFVSSSRWWSMSFMNDDVRRFLVWFSYFWRF